MAASGDAVYRQFLLDHDYWAPRLRRLDDEPRNLVQIPRTDLSRPGIEVTELRLRAHDGAPLRALLARSAFQQSGAQVHLRLCEDLDTCALDWRAVEQGTSDLVFHYPPERRLEDRVLDVLRLTEAACSLEAVDCSDVRFYSGCQSPPDEFVIAELVRDKGWI